MHKPETLALPLQALEAVGGWEVQFGHILFPDMWSVFVFVVCYVFSFNFVFIACFYSAIKAGVFLLHISMTLLLPNCVQPISHIFIVLLSTLKIHTKLNQSVTAMIWIHLGLDHGLPALRKEKTEKK